MKLCDIASFYSELGGGVKTYHHAKLKYFAARPEHEYILVVAAKEPGVENVPGGRIYRVKGFPVAWNGAYRQIYDLHEIRRILKHERPSVIEAGSPYLDGWLALLCRKEIEVKVVGFYHADVPDSYIAPAVRELPATIGNSLVRFARWYFKSCYERFDATVVASLSVQKKLEKMGLGNTYQVPLGVDSQLFSPDKRSEKVRRELGAQTGDKILLFAGRFSKEKGIETLVEVIRAIDGREGARIVLVGDGPHREFVYEALKGCKKTALLGYVDDPIKLASIYASSDLFFSPGAYETFGLAALEAMSAGLPVIGANSRGTGELVAASGAGGVFKAHDPSDAIQWIEKALESDTSRQRKQVREFVERNYCWSHTFDRMVAFYEDLAREKQHSTSFRRNWGGIRSEYVTRSSGPVYRQDRP